MMNVRKILDTTKVSDWCRAGGHYIERHCSAWIRGRVKTFRRRHEPKRAKKLPAPQHREGSIFGQLGLRGRRHQDNG
jgi:hypothetical protein